MIGAEVDRDGCLPMAGKIRSNGATQRGHINPEIDVVDMFHLVESIIRHASGHVSETLKHFQVGDGDQDQALEELPGFRLPPGGDPEGFEGLMGLPPVTVVEQVDAV